MFSFGIIMLLKAEKYDNIGNRRLQAQPILLSKLYCQIFGLSNKSLHSSSWS